MKEIPDDIKYERRKIGKGKYIIDGFYANDTLFFIEEGVAAVMLYGENGEETRIYRYLPASFFGELETFSRHTLPFPVVAKEECVVVLIKKEEALKWMRQDPDFSLTIIRGICDKLLDGTEGKIKLQYMSGKQRYLKAMKEHVKNNDLDKLSKAQLAEEICLPIRSLNRVIAQCKRYYYFEKKHFHISK